MLTIEAIAAASAQIPEAPDHPADYHLSGRTDYTDFTVFTLHAGLLVIEVTENRLGHPPVVTATVRTRGGH